MLTTTPFFRPREGCEPRPIDLDRPVGGQFADERHDLGGADVQAHDQFRSERLAIRITSCPLPSPASVRRTAAPADRKSIGVAHVDVGDVGGALADQRAAPPSGSARSARRPAGGRGAPHTPLSSCSSQAPRASSRSACRRMPDFHEAPLHGEIARRPRRLRCLAGPTSCGSSGGTRRASLANSSPRVLSRSVSFQRATACCSVDLARAGRSASCAARWRAPTQGSRRSDAAHVVELHATRPAPCSWAHRLSTSSGCRCWNCPSTRMRSIGWFDERQPGRRRAASAPASAAPPVDGRNACRQAAARSCQRAPGSAPTAVVAARGSAWRRAPGWSRAPASTSSSKSMPAARAAFGTRL